jgi:prepilin-type N-terminal cleavage/methylation domain-containing protein
MRATKRRSDEATKGRRRGFTLMELVVVIGVLVLLMGLAVPLIGAFRGNRSIEAAQGRLSALLSSARAQAMEQQRTTGILFHLDSNTRRIAATLVYDSGRPPAGGVDVFLDAVGDIEPVLLPLGVMVQTIDNKDLSGAVQVADGYIGLNRTPAAHGLFSIPIGGALLFDSHGRLLSQRYGFVIWNGSTWTPMARLLYQDRPQGDPFWSTPPPPNEHQGFQTVLLGDEAGGAPRSALGLVLFDWEYFRNRNFTDGDPQFDSNYAWAPFEAEEEQWIDDNSIPLLVNRYNGTLIRGE